MFFLKQKTWTIYLHEEKIDSKQNFVIFFSVQNHQQNKNAAAKLLSTSKKTLVQFKIENIFRLLFQIYYKNKKKPNKKKLK